MKTLHNVVGFGGLLVFLVTGLYMKTQFPALYDGNEASRMMFRASHIYLLLAALLNIVVANQSLPQLRQSLHIVWTLASLLLVAAPMLFCIGFFYESPSYNIGRPFTVWAVWGMLVGVLLQSLLRYVCGRTPRC